MRARGGRLVVVDPRRSRTARGGRRVRGHPAGHRRAPAHRAWCTRCSRKDWSTSGGSWRPGSTGSTSWPARQGLHPGGRCRRCAASTPATIRRLARELAAAPTACVYGRIGHLHAGVRHAASWLVDVLNVFTGNLDRRGGAMFALPAAGGPTTRGKPGSRPRLPHRPAARTRVRGLPEMIGEYPAVALAEEIETPGEGQIRALVTLAGNPVLLHPERRRGSTPRSPTLDFMVCVDIYVNETTRHADVILPSPRPLQRSHYDVALLQLAVRNVANYSARPSCPSPDQPDEWEILAKLRARRPGQGPTADPAVVDDLAIAGLVDSRRRRDEPGPRARRRRDPRRAGDRARPGAPARLHAANRPVRREIRRGSRRAQPRRAAEANPHGVDLGPLEPRLPEMPAHAYGRIELAPAALVADLARLAAALEASRAVARASRQRQRSCSSAAGTCARTTPGCTTSTCS